MKKLKMGMIGGGIGSFIGAIHRNAANLDNCIELVSGSFSSDFNIKSPKRGIFKIKSSMNFLPDWVE